VIDLFPGRLHLTSGCTGARTPETVRCFQGRRARPVNLDVRQPPSRWSDRSCALPSTRATSGDHDDYFGRGAWNGFLRGGMTGTHQRSRSGQLSRAAAVRHRGVAKAYGLEHAVAYGLRSGSLSGSDTVARDGLERTFVDTPA
jgi:hypothetical protein